uniref:Uncharacterized protein n=1 Tax=Candidatus Kentrum sp. MB TaxID=2138164 RepID=A0A451BB40_9GAMM|nr:MAG: hypothetical protein BECKMB1821G_GA0114241_102634 [Candidatus Kentron sp. MB]VFK31093.1 MAG: hypothetical protein BECKMB1821I_GA0114274_102034 [Candidatus Kentron sp. MB]VFK75516.1 MAG: hypothetical protein BECKMB1821H_GA0114242_102433 [Candidatus Kentron sp. MB]
MNAPIVDEVRRAREEPARRFDYDLAAICRDIRKRQSGYGVRYGNSMVRLRRNRREIQPVCVETSSSARALHQ